MSNILITPRSLTTNQAHPELQRLRVAGHDLVFSEPGRLPTADELLALVGPCVGWLAGVEMIDRRILESAPGLVVIARLGVGLDSIDLPAAEGLGVEVVPAIGSNAQGVAELAVLMALSSRRPISLKHPISDSRAWDRSQGSELSGRIAAVIGYGAVGRRVARLFNAFGMDVRVVDPVADVEPEFPTFSLDKAIADADVVSLHCPPRDNPLLGSNELRSMAPAATVINTARGRLVDLNAMLAALESGQVATYACDAYATEPPDPHPLWSHAGVMATPHLGGFTAESGQRAAAMAVDAILDRIQ